MNKIKKISNAIKQKELEKNDITPEAANPQLDQSDIIKNLECRLNEYEKLFKILSLRLSDVEKELEIYKKAHQQGFDEIVTSTDYDEDLLKHPNLMPETNTNEVADLSESISNDLIIHEVEISGDNNSEC